MRLVACLISFLTLILFCPTFGQRQSVLSQIDLPHSYYYREMYLPQLTSGPSAADWTADGNSVVYSMGGSLWIQSVNSEYAEQLTDGDGYDFQPDVSPDGRSILFVRYTGSSVDLMLFDLQSRKTGTLTEDRSVNLEPRWSPDGNKIAFVSTQSSGHFLLYTASIQLGDIPTLKDLRCITPDRKSSIKRYYYSAWDHALHPVWSHDGQSLFFVSNHEVIYGTGDLVRYDLTSGMLAEQVKVLVKEETNWRMRPDVSPDGTRIVYSSYAGRNYHQLWTVPTQGGTPIPLTNGDFDNFSPRWSPDGKSILMVSNRDGNLVMYVLDVFRGGQRRIRNSQLNYLQGHQNLRLEVRDEKGALVPARVSITDSRGKFHAPVLEWIHADDGVYTAQHKFEQHYFHISGSTDISVPADKLLITISHGPQYEISKLNVDATRSLTGPVTITLKSFTFPNGFGSWRSADLHVHMNYGGNYLNHPQRLLRMAASEDVQYVFNLIVNKEQRMPDISLFTSESIASPSGNALLMYGQEFHTSYWGHLGLLNLTKNLITPGYSGYPQTSAASLFPDNNFVARSARDQKSVVGYVHPFEVAEVIPGPSAGLTNQLPISAALGLVDYYELIGFSDHRASELVWHHLLNCGIRIPAGAGTDLMGNFSSLRGPIGLNRVMVQETELLDKNAILQKIRSGKSIVTNAPIIGFTVNGKLPGDQITAPSSGATLNYSAFLRSQIPMDVLEVVWNGKVIATHPLADTKRFADVEGRVKVKGPGWLVLRAVSKNAHPDLLDLYPFATTNPIYIETPDQHHFTSKESAAWFLPWVNGLEQATINFSSFRTEEERKEILDQIRLAKVFFEKIAGSSPVKK